MKFTFFAAKKNKFFIIYDEMTRKEQI